MHLATMVEMVEAGLGDRCLLGTGDGAVTGNDLGRLVRAAAGSIARHRAVVYVGENHPMLPVVVLAAAWAGVPFVPLNYRLDDQQLDALAARQPDPLVLCDAATAARISSRDVQQFDSWLATLDANEPRLEPADDDDQVAIVLYTSGTTSEPKAALLRHRHLMAYLLGSVEFAAADPDEAVLVSVPPYHVAGMANLFSNLYAGRRLVYLRSFDPTTWLDVVRNEGITNAMVVPTMLARIVEVLGGEPADVPSLRSMSYGGSRIAERVLVEALAAFPTTGFVNAYGLTETTSTIAVLGPEDHRAALAMDDPHARRRLSSAGRLLPTVDVEVRDDDGNPVGAGSIGIIHVRGDQVAGEYASGSVLDANGWFNTRDRGFVDADGYLFIEGRADDTIIRGGENIAPAEIEEVLYRDADVLEACVVGIPDEEWGQRIAAVVVRRNGVVDEEALKARVRAELRGSKTPEIVLFRDALPHTATGKLLRRQVVDDIISQVEAR